MKMIRLQTEMSESEENRIRSTIARALDLNPDSVTQNEIIEQI